jgi:glycerophosphoryl diester phosphodiesterase
MLHSPFDLQGHRGARGLKPENTLPSFEVALDVGVTSIETDIHLTADGIPVLFHDSHVVERLCRTAPGCAVPESPALVRALTLAQLRGCRADRNPAPDLFPEQNAAVTPLAEWFARAHATYPFTPPTLVELFTFCAAYAGAPGTHQGKTEAQRARAARLHFDLELKRVPFRPDVMGDSFDGQAQAELERAVVAAVRQASVLQRTRLRSFDHRCVRALRQLEPTLTTAVLIAGTAPIDPAALVRQAEAQVYCPDVESLDEMQVRQLQAQGIRVLPWTVNRSADWLRLLDWGVDGITTDYPDRLGHLLDERGIEY